MDEVLGAVVDPLELVIELQHGLHRLLEHVDHAHAPARLAARKVRVTRLDHLVQQRVVVLEALVEQVVVGPVAHVHGADEVHRRPVVVGVAHDAGLERAAAGGVGLEAQEAGVRIHLLGCLGLRFRILRVCRGGLKPQG